MQFMTLVGAFGNFISQGLSTSKHEVKVKECLRLPFLISNPITIHVPLPIPLHQCLPGLTLCAEKRLSQRASPCQDMLQAWKHQRQTILVLIPGLTPLVQEEYPVALSSYHKHKAQSMGSSFVQAPLKCHSYYDYYYR